MFAYRLPGAAFFIRIGISGPSETIILLPVLSVFFYFLLDILNLDENVPKSKGIFMDIFIL